MIMMIVSVATGIGLQQKIRDKVSAFNGHIIISNYDNNQSEVTLVPISKNQDFYPKFTSVPAVNHIQAIASKAGIIRTETAFEGIILKGVGTDYQWDNIKEYIVSGKLHKRLEHATGGGENSQKLASNVLVFTVGSKPMLLSSSMHNL